MTESYPETIAEEIGENPNKRFGAPIRCRDTGSGRCFPATAQMPHLLRGDVLKLRRPYVCTLSQLLGGRWVLGKRMTHG